MPKKKVVTVRQGNADGKPANALPSMGSSSHQFMPNFGIDIPMGMNMGPAFAKPGAPDRPQHPSHNAGRKVVTKSSGNKPVVKSGKKQLSESPVALVTPPPLHQKSKAGIPPPPSHGTRNKATLPSVKLNSMSGTESPTIIKSQPLPKIGSSKPKQQANETSQDLSDVEMVLYGHITSDLPEPPSHLVRVFLSSTFSDMKAERNEIWTTVYPALRKHCLSHGLDFSFVDMRWGVLDYATDHHKTEDIVLAEVKRTIKVSAATSFLSIIGHRYGSIVNESTTPCDKFNILVEMAKSHNLENKELLELWYRRDDNNIPPLHFLQPISMMLPDYNSTDAEKKAEATAEWNRVNSVLYKVRYEATKLAVEAGKLDAQHLENMEKSVTTTEIETGILGNPHASGSSYAIYRELKGIEEDVEVESTAKFIDVEAKDGKTVVNTDNLTKIDKFIGHPIGKLLSSDSRKKYTVQWHNGGIPTDVSEQSESDREFLSTLSHDLTSYLIKATDLHLSSLQNEPTEYKVSSTHHLPLSRVTEKHVCTPECVMKCALASKNALMMEYKSMESMGNVALPSTDYKEILHHLRLADIKTRLYCGRKSQLEVVKKHLQKVEISSPLMIYGSGGGGKTPFAGQVAKSVHKWLGSGAVVAVRFLGSSQTSEQTASALRSIIVQLSCAYQVDCRVSERSSLKLISTKLKSLLTVISYMCLSQNRPCVIILDGLEHLRAVNNTHSLSWLPDKLPPKVHIITAFNPDEFNLLSTAKARFSKFLELPAMTVDDMMEFMDKTLEYHNRRLTPVQREALQEHLRTHPYPVYAQMMVNLALETPSDINVTSNLSDNMEDAIVLFLRRLEKRYGEKFVTYTLAYITCGHSGISEMELEDALSSSDEVLVEVYVYHEPPVKGTIRIPSHLWPMLRNELDPFLVEKSTNDYTLISWYHGYVEKMVNKRYLYSTELQNKYHRQLSEIYLSRDGVHRTITLTRLRKPITIENADRQIATFARADMMPMRVLYSMIHHLTRLNDMDEVNKTDLDTLKSMTICNVDYITTVWKKIDLKTMSNITNSVIEDLQNRSCAGDKELQAMAAFYDDRLVCLGLQKFSQESLIDFYITLVGAFSPDRTTPNINSLIDRAKAELHAAQIPLLIPTDNCTFFGQDKLRYQFTNCDRVLSDIEDNTALISLATKSHKTVETVDINETKVYSLSTKAKITAIRLAQRRVFALTDQSVVVQSCSKDQPSQTSFKTDSFSKGEFLNRCIAVSGTAKLICLGGKERLGVYEDKIPTSDKPEYKGVSTLNLGGVKSTDAIVFTTDEKYTISAHAIAAKNRTVGGLVKWDYETKTTESRLSLPSPILKNCLHLLTDEDRAICACDHTEIFVVSFKEQRIVKKLAHDKNSWIDMSVDGDQLAVVFDNSEVKIWDLANLTSVLLTSAHGATSVYICPSQSLVCVGNDKGCVEFYDSKKAEHIRMLHISISAIACVRVVSEQYMVVYDSADDVFVLSLEKLMNDNVETTAQVANDLGSSCRGVFSSSGESVLVERSVDEPASLFSTVDFTSIDLSASTGFRKLALCADASYLVGQKEESLKVWDLGKGQEIIPPPDIEEQCSSIVEPFYTCSDEPTVIFAYDGRLTQWTLSDNKVVTSSYIRGSPIEKITTSKSLISLFQRSGSRSYDNWVVHVIERESGKTLVSLEREELVQDVHCLDKTALYLSNGTCYLVDVKTSDTKELKLSAPVRLIASSPQGYVVVEGEKTVALLDGISGEMMCSMDINEKILGIVYTTDGYTLLSLNFSRIQLVAWQIGAGAPSLSNIIQVICGHLSAYIDKSKQLMFVYGRLLDESRLLTFDMKDL